MSAREIMAKVFSGAPYPSKRTYDRVTDVLDALTDAGYVILSPDEVRGIRDAAFDEAIKASLGHQGKQFTNHRGHVDWAPASKYDVAAAIRSLKGGRDAQ